MIIWHSCTIAKLHLFNNVLLPVPFPPNSRYKEKERGFCLSLLSLHWVRIPTILFRLTPSLCFNVAVWWPIHYSLLQFPFSFMISITIKHLILLSTPGGRHTPLCRFDPPPFLGSRRRWWSESIPCVKRRHLSPSTKTNRCWDAADGRLPGKCAASHQTSQSAENMVTKIVRG